MKSAPQTPLAIRRQAVQWLVSRHSGTWDAEQQARLDEWLDAHATHRHAFEQARITWGSLGDVMASDASRKTAARKFQLVSFRSRLQQWFIPGLTFATAVSLVSLFVVEPWWSGSPQTYSTARGQQKTITLVDGSRIALNSNSEIIARIGHVQRTVELKNGEALFTIIHDESRPFTVLSGAGDIRDIGTIFNVELERNRVMVSVLEGQVTVTADRAHKQVANLGAGQGVAFDTTGMLSPVSRVEADDVLAWREWKHVFREQPLGEALQHLLSYHDVSFEFADPELARMPISGSFNVQDLGVFLRTLESTFPVRVRVLYPHHISLQRAG